MKTFPLFLLAALLLVVTGCEKSPKDMTKEEKLATLPAKVQPLFYKSWKMDVNESTKMNTDAVEGATGIKADIKLGGDVAKMADFAAKKLYFGFEKDKLNTIYEESFGEGLLSTSATGWLTVDKDATSMTFKDPQGKETVYLIKELGDDKLVLQLKESKVFEVFTKK